MFATSHAFPNQTYKDTNYWVDVVFSRDDSTPPSVASTTPWSGATSVSRTIRPSVTFAATVDPTSVQMTLTPDGGSAVSGTTTFDAATRTARFTPAAALEYGRTYTASVTARSAAGATMPTPYTWSFTVSTTDPLPGVCPCSLWPDSATPATPTTSDTARVQLGVKFRSDVSGLVTGIRFYKGTLNVGTHEGAVWTATGDLLGTVTFSAESTSGWQTAYFTSPVAIAANTTYIASYLAPNGGYALTTSGLSTPVDAIPLHTTATGGVYTYGTGAPLSTSTSNYWVDVVFVATDEAPTVTSTSPTAGSTNARTTGAVSATLSGPTQNGTATIGLRTSAGEQVSGTVAFDATTRTVSFTPSAALADGQAYTATVSGAVSLAGNLMSPASWSFTTAGITACPCTLFPSSEAPVTGDSGDNDPYELGVAFTPSNDGQVTGVRFWKSAANTGTHTGSLWSADGQRLATGTFSGETGTGWQTLKFRDGVAVSAGTTYVVSYFAPQGRYAADGGYFSTPVSNGPLSAGTTNGRFAAGTTSRFPTGTWKATNYWVDPIFETGTPTDTTPPDVVGVTPLAGTTNARVDTRLTATFSEPADPASAVITVTTSDGASIAGTTSYDGTTRTATFTPSSALPHGTVLTARVVASDVVGNAAPAFPWSFTTAGVTACPCTLFPSTAAPTKTDTADNGPLELGVSFSSAVDGSVTGIRFWKGSANTGTHVGSLWSGVGSAARLRHLRGRDHERLADDAVQHPGAGDGRHDLRGLLPCTRGPLRGRCRLLHRRADERPAHRRHRQRAVLVRPAGTFPTSSYRATNYWVDPVFQPSASDDTTPPTISDVSASVSGTTATITWTTDESATTSVAYGTSAGSLGSTATGASGTSHSVTLTGLDSTTTYYYRVTSADAAGTARPPRQHPRFRPRSPRRTAAPRRSRRSPPRCRAPRRRSPGRRTSRPRAAWPTAPRPARSVPPPPARPAPHTR